MSCAIAATKNMATIALFAWTMMIKEDMMTMENAMTTRNVMSTENVMSTKNLMIAGIMMITTDRGIVSRVKCPATIARTTHKTNGEQ